MLVKYMRMLSLLKRFLWRCTRNVDFAPQRCYVGFKLPARTAPANHVDFDSLSRRYAPCSQRIAASSALSVTRTPC